MNKQQQLFLLQARSDFEIFKIWNGNENAAKQIAVCHRLHYYQMALEKLAKAYFWKSGYPGVGHAVIVKFFRSLNSNVKSRETLGYASRKQWGELLRNLLPLAREIENLTPDLAQTGPNVEYPWPPEMPLSSPLAHHFRIWDDLHQTTAGRHFLNLVERIIPLAEGFF